MADLFDSSIRLGIQEFHAFYNERPEREKWELIDGVAITMSPPTLMHQRISANLELFVNRRLELVQGDSKNRTLPGLTRAANQIL